MPTRLLGALAIIVVFSIVMGRKNRKRQMQTWTGAVTEVRHQRPSVARDQDRPDQDWVIILYRKDDGSDGRLKVRMASLRQFLPGLQAGDRLVKRQGDYLPRRAVPQAEPAAPADPA